MFLSRIQIKNFRNFHDLDVNLGPTSVIVGENGVGKSNLLFALRLILDPTLPDSARNLREEDFWEGATEPVKSGEVIEIVVEFQDFQYDPNVLALLTDYCVKGPVVDTARLTYRFRPKLLLAKDRELSIEDFEFTVFGGSDESNKVDFYLRRWIPMEVLPALRDAERHLAAWRQSPLRPLVENLNIPASTLEGVANSIDQATRRLLAEGDVRSLTQDIQVRLSKMVGSVIEIDPSLGFTSAIPERLTRALRIFGDGVSQRPVSELSLGVNNILYLLLLALELERKEAASERATTVLAIEEPEAHLHPHLQRLVFRDFLRRESPILLTTHSPHIASVAPLKSVVLLRNDPSSQTTSGTSTLQTNLGPQEITDLERYLDATRAEVLFARGVILVEGTSELYLIPAAAKHMGKTLDEYGVTVCSVHGTDFRPYVKLLGPKGLNIPFVVLTDGDWYTTKSGEELSRGLRRAVTIAEATEHPEAPKLGQLFSARQWSATYDAAKKARVFVGGRTLEVDLFDSLHGVELVESLQELGLSKARVQTFQELALSQAPLSNGDARSLLRSINRYGKGRVAQRFTGKVDSEKFPNYIREGILEIVGACSK